MIKLKFKDGKFIQNEKLGHIIEVGMESTLDIKLVSNLKENYFIVQTMAKGEPNNIFIKVDLDSNKMGDSKGLRLNEVMELNDIEFYKVENDKIYFLANSNRMTLLDGVCNDIIEFYIRDGKPVFDSILSKTKNTKIFHYGLDDIVTYATLNTDNEKYELNFTSSDISFKVKNNGIRDSEIQYAITKVIEADFYGSCCLLVSAFK